MRESKNVVNLIDYFEDDHSFYLVTQYKPTLRDYTNDSKAHHFDENRVASFMLPIVKAVRRLHKKNVVHRNLCMETICTKMRKGGQVKVKLSCLDMAFCLKAGQ